MAIPTEREQAAKLREFLREYFIDENKITPDAMLGDLNFELGNIADLATRIEEYFQLEAGSLENELSTDTTVAWLDAKIRSVSRGIAYYLARDPNASGEGPDVPRPR